MEIETSDALSILGVSRRDWRVAMDQGHFACAPPTVAANRRCWSVDDLVLLAWFNSLHLAGMQRPFAGDCAAGLKRAMADHPRAASFNVYTVERDGYGELWFLPSSAPPPDDPTAQLIFTAPVREWRRSIEAAVDRHFEERAGRDASDRPS